MSKKKDTDEAFKEAVQRTAAATRSPNYSQEDIGRIAQEASQVYWDAIGAGKSREEAERAVNDLAGNDTQDNAE